MKYADQEYIRWDPFGGDEATIECRSVKLVTARKSHACFLGQSPDGEEHSIQPGDRYRSERALIDGSFWGCYRCCIPCMDTFLDELKGAGYGLQDRSTHS